ncbi:MAG: hypothetical protein WB683_09800 [Candidatus Sulfotelmatobacter sp.]
MLASGIAYASDQWSSFFSAEVSAAAALTGLLFVAVSINLAKIISFANLPPKAARALVTLIGILFAASLCLVPGQPTRMLGWELTILGTIFWGTITFLQRSHSYENPYMNRMQKLLGTLLAQISELPIIVCGVSLLCRRGGGLYWMVSAVIVSFASAVFDTWVLLVEILR